MHATLSCAYLRVYQTLHAFSPAERERIRSLLSDGGSVAHPHALGLIAPAERREVFTLESAGTPYYCPAETRLRSLLGMLAFQRALPEGVAQVFFSPEEMDDARRELEQLQSDGPELRPYLLQSAWHVPLRWFVVFDDTERLIEDGDEGLRLRYQTTMPKALERVAAALKVLKGGVVHPVVVGMIYELHEWLRSFDEQSLVELDYASVSKLFEPDELADDHSAADVGQAIEALAEGDGMRAALFYQRVNERWAPKRAHESLN